MITNTGPTSVTVNWSPPANANGILLHYNVYLERETDGQLETVNETLVEAIEGENSYSYEFTNLLAFTLYEIRVSAATRIGDGSSAEGFVTTDPDAASTPSFIDGEVLNSTVIQLSWGYPGTPRGNITGYIIFTNAVTAGQLNITLSVMNDMQNQIYVFGGLLPFTDYHFSVGAFAVTEELTHYGELSDMIKLQTDEYCKFFQSQMCHYSVTCTS